MDKPEIIKGLIRGDQAVFTEVVNEWQHMIYNTALSIVQQNEDAEDITQDVFVTLYEKINEFREESALSTWLYRITVRKALDHEKKKRRRKYGGFLKRIFSIEEKEAPVNFDHPGILLDNKEKASVLFMALKKLPEKQRVAFTLHKMEGLNHQQIAAVMNTSVVSVESLQVRAKNGLKKILKEYYEKNS